jgi:hypothetical protein
MRNRHLGEMEYLILWVELQRHRGETSERLACRFLAEATIDTSSPASGSTSRAPSRGRRKVGTRTQGPQRFEGNTWTWFLEGVAYQVRCAAGNAACIPAAAIDPSWLVLSCCSCRLLSCRCPHARGPQGSIFFSLSCRIKFKSLALFGALVYQTGDIYFLNYYQSSCPVEIGSTILVTISSSIIMS